MVSDKQLQANRLNAKKSTGPRTLRGKAVSRFNALYHGIYASQEVIPGEDHVDLQNLATLYTLRWDPQLPEERCLVDTLTACEWQLRRCRRVDAALWKHFDLQYRTQDGRMTPAPIAAALVRAKGEFQRLQRRADSAQRTFERTLAILQSMAAAAEADLDAEAYVEAEADIDIDAARLTDAEAVEAAESESVEIQAAETAQPEAEAPQPVEAAQPAAPPPAAQSVTPAEPLRNQPHPSPNGFVPSNPETPALPLVQSPGKPGGSLAA